MSALYLPKHIAIIPDGNGRWAKSKALSVNEGHKAGMDALEKAIVYIRDLGVKYLTIYAFSSENWKREESERQGIFNLAEQFFSLKSSEIIDGRTKVSILGEIEPFPKFFKDILENVLEKTKNHKDFFLQIALNYGGRAEIIRAVKQIVAENKDGKLSESINEETFSKYLYTQGIPDPDLLIRTGDVYRVSNFLLYQSSYSELVFLKKYWPDITSEDIEAALEIYSKRERRFGGRNG